jgi:hypothetical protein
MFQDLEGFLIKIRLLVYVITLEKTSKVIVKENLLNHLKSQITQEKNNNEKI